MKTRTQTELVQAKLLLQAKRVLTKLKPKKNSREITNEEIEIALYQYSSSGNVKNEYGDEMFEWLHERLCLLSQEQMDILKKRYWEASSFAIIGNEMGHFHDPKWAQRKLDEILRILRENKK